MHTGRDYMIAFLGWVVHYLIVLVVLAVFAGLGLTIGIKLRKKKDAKETQMTDTVDQAVEDK